MHIAELAGEIREAREEVPARVRTPSSAGSWPTMIVSPSPNRNPVITGLETKSERPPSRSSPASASTPAATSASAAESAAKRAASPSASGPTAAAESALVAVVALTTSDREDPSRAYASSAPGAAISPASGGSPAICAYAIACGVTTPQTITPATRSAPSHSRR